MERTKSVEFIKHMWAPWNGFVLKSRVGFSYKLIDDSNEMIQRVRTYRNLYNVDMLN